MWEKTSNPFDFEDFKIIAFEIRGKDFFGPWLTWSKNILKQDHFSTHYLFIFFFH